MSGQAAALRSRPAGLWSRLATPRTAVLLGVLVLVLALLVVPLAILAGATGDSSGGGEYLGPAFGLVGFLVAWRRPGNPLGWLLLGAVGFLTLSSDAGLYAVATDEVSRSRAKYYPGSSPLHVRLVHTRQGRLLGGQLAGREGAAKPDRFEGEGRAFHETLRKAFLDIAAAEPKRCIVINADQPSEDVAKDIWAHVRERFLKSRRTGAKR